MIVRWQERKTEDELLKRELLLRLRTGYTAAPGRSRPVADDFHRRARGLLLRHPLFAFEYYRLARVSAGPGVSRKMPADDPCAPFPFDFDAAYKAEGWSARIVWRPFAYETEPDEETEGSGIENPTGRVLAHRVGDVDRVYAFDPDDLALLKGARLAETGMRRRLILFACVLAGVVLAAAAATVVERHHLGSSGRAAATANSHPALLRFPGTWWHPPRVVSTSTVGTRNHPHAPKRVERPTARAARRPAQQTVLVSNTVPTASVPTTAAGKPHVAVAAHDHGPAPLSAPPGVSAPGPLKAP